MADFLFTKNQTSAPDIAFLMDAFASFGYAFGASPPFADANDLYNVIDSIPLGDAPWHSFTASFTGAIPEENAPHWMTSKYDVWCRNPLDVIRNLLANPEFKGEFDYAPYREFDHHLCRQYGNFMSGNWAWRHAVSISFTLSQHFEADHHKCCFRTQLLRMIQPRKGPSLSRSF